MARIFISGSSDGLGLVAARLLAADDHDVILHARNSTRAEQARTTFPQAAAVVIGDVSNMAECRSVAEQVNRLGRCDAVIHNVGIGYGEQARSKTEDGLPELFAVNVLAPYLLTALIHRPARLVYLSSSMHLSGDPDLDDPQWEKRKWNGPQAYSDSKLFDTMLAFAVARLWPQVLSNAVDPGWVPTRMGGPNAPDDLTQGAVTQAWLATSNNPEAQVTGRYFRHQEPRQPHPAAERQDLQEQLLAYCAKLTGVRLEA